MDKLFLTVLNISKRISSNKHVMKDRIKRVLNFRKPSRVIIVVAAALAVVLSVGVAVNRSDDLIPMTMKNVHMEPHFSGVITKVTEYSILVLVNEDEDTRQSSDLIYVSLDVKLKDSISTWFVNDEVIVYYNGEILESYPAQVNTVYAIVMKDNSISMNSVIMLDDLRDLAAKGYSLMFEDFQGFRGVDASSDTGFHIMVYSVESGYRLIVRSKINSRPDSISLESIWESSGSGIDIRYDDIDEYIRTHPSHSAIIGEEALTIAKAYANKKLTFIDVDWWEREDEFPHDSKDPFKRKLDESLNRIEPCELFIDGEGGFIAVTRKYGTVYVYSDGAWVMAADNNEPTGAASSEILNKIYLGMTTSEVYELFGEPDYHASGLMWFGYNNIGTFNPASDYGYTDLNGQSDFIVKFGSWSIYDFVDAAIKQHYADDTPSEEYPTQSHVLYMQSADKNGFTVWLMSLYQTYLPDGEYNVRLVRNSSIPLQLSFAKNADGDYMLTSYYERSGEWPFDTPPNTEHLESNCYTDAMNHFVGAIPSNGRYSVGVGTAVLTGVADDTADPWCFNIKYFPGATLQIEQSENELEYTMAKPNSWIIEYADSSKNIIVDRNGTGVIPITDDLIGIYNTDSGQYTMKFEKYVRYE